MAKKSRRARKHRPKIRPQTVAAEPTVQAAKKPAAPRPSTVNFSEEYRYVIADLKRIGILAGTMMGLLVVLSFIIR
jgi:hypothetical protein